MPNTYLRSGRLFDILIPIVESILMKYRSTIRLSQIFAQCRAPVYSVCQDETESEISSKSCSIKLHFTRPTITPLYSSLGWLKLYEILCESRLMTYFFNILFFTKSSPYICNLFKNLIRTTSIRDSFLLLYKFDARASGGKALGK